MRLPRGRHILLLALAVACLAHMSLVVLARLDENRLDDDAYMFVRYARNTLHHGSVSWNPDGEPTYGLTSLGHFVVVLILETALRIDAAWVLLLSTLLAGTAFVVLALSMAWIGTARGPTSARQAAVLVVLLCLALGMPGLASHFVNGMDAAFALVMLTVYLIVATSWFQDPGTPRALGTGIVCGFLLWVRPDILLFAFVPAVFVFVWPPSSIHRRAALQLLGITTLTGVVLAGLAWAYFGTPVPLPTWGKVLRGYGSDMQQVYAHFPAEQLMFFVRDHAVALLVAALGMALILRRRGIRAASLELGVWMAAVLFLIFHRFFVLAIMGSHARFYYPLLPAVLFLVSQVVLTMATLPAVQSWCSRMSTSRRRAASLSVVLVVGVAAALSPVARQSIDDLRAQPRLQHFAVADNFTHNWPSEYWMRLDAFSALPDDLVIATTEVGYPGVLNPEKTIVDLAGLNDRIFALQGFSAPALFQRYQPDLFLLPRSHYAVMRNELTRSPEFRSNYEYFTPPKGLAIALRRDSQHYPAMRRVLGLR